MKKNKILLISIIICLAIIIAGIVVAIVSGVNTDIIYGKNIRIDVYVGKEFDKGEVEQIAKEVFETNKVLVNKVEYYGDMFTLTISQDIENVDEKVDKFNTRINEKYEIENKTEDIVVEYQPSVDLNILITPYILPFAISLAIILVYAIIRFKKIGILKTLGMYILTAIITVATYASILIICRVPINRIVVPCGLLIYVLAITIVTILRERTLTTYRLEEKSKRK